MASYGTFAKFYDATRGDTTETTTLLQELIRESYPNGAKHLLELACGTGSILKALSHTYQVVGLDISEDMLEIARKKVPEATFYHRDMRTFSLPMSFDLILCVYDSINLLLTFAEWQSLFRQVNRHLNAHGLFIFDLNTLPRLHRLAQLRDLVEDFEGNYLLVKLLEVGPDLYNWKFQSFEQIGDDLYHYHEENVLETSFAIPQIEQAVKEHFEIKRVFDPQHTEVLPNSERVYFVCQKRE